MTTIAMVVTIARVRRFFHWSFLEAVNKTYCDMGVSIIADMVVLIIKET